MTGEFSPIWQADWQDPSHFQLSIPQQSWLLDAGSLTARLKAQTNSFLLHRIKEFEILLPEFLQQRWQTQQGMVREVLLMVDHQPYVYAQSFWSANTQLGLVPLANLGNIPLGEYIFQQPLHTRTPLQIARIPNAWPLIAEIEGQQMEPLLHSSDQIVSDLWGRRSFFAISGHELLVQEVFLPSVWQ